MLKYFFVIIFVLYFTAHIFSSTTNSVNGLALCYDELSLVVGKKVNNDERKFFNIYLLNWIYENIASIFAKYFCSINEPENLRDLPLELKFKLNDADTIYIDIAGGVLKPSPR